MSYDFSKFKKETAEVESRLSKEFSAIRTGRATPAILDGISVEAYGSRMPLNQIGSINIEDAKTLRVSPWDSSQTKAVESAIASAALGLSVTADEKGVRVIFPDLTGERRAILIKTAKEKLEEARVRLRKERDDAWQDIQKKEKEGGMSEDEKFRLKDELQKSVEKVAKQLEEMFERKEKEINS